MAFTSAQQANSFNHSSSKTFRRKYDVFLSFRGEDVRDNFLEYVYRALRQKGISTFKDDDKLKDGEDIKKGLYKAIEESSFSIVIISIDYANSSWCLDELVHILHCKRTTGHVIFPVFYRVLPSHVRNREGEFGMGFAKAASANEGKVEKWVEALKEVANLKGWAFPKNPQFENEAKLIDNLVHKLFIKAINTYPIPAEDLIGIKCRMVEVIKLLDLGSDEFRVVGLWGMGGIGKSTLAKVVYDSISCQFDACSFIDNVSEISNKNGILALQERLISDILIEKDFKVPSATHRTRIIQNMVCSKKVLIVLDDVSERKQLENLFGGFQWFSSGSRIIITTRDQQVLDVQKGKYVFKVKELNKREATKLFKSKAFAEEEETKEFTRLIKSIVQYAKGVPLALKVLGSFLMGGNVQEWESALARLKESPHDEIQQLLRISYDGLHWTEKEIFLDIACFFRGMGKDPVINILDSCGFNAVFGVKVLVQKSLLTISVDNKLQMHDLIRNMGWSIVDEESRKEPGERSRLWRPNDVKDVLVDNTGTRNVEGILFHPENVKPRPDAFAKMPKLRLLMIHGSCCAIDLPNKLRLLIWDGYPLKYMPPTFQPEHLVELRLTNSHIKQLWDRKVILPKLTLIDLGHSTSLVKGPDFSGFPNLEELVFEGCTALLDLHPSIKNLKRLKILSLKGCSSLHFLPYGIESRCLQTLIFSGCVKLNNILESFGDLKLLSQLDLHGTYITELPHSIGNSTNLFHLDLSGCIYLKSIPSSIGQLKKLKKLLLKECYCLSKLPDEVGLMESLEILDVSSSGIMPLIDTTVRISNTSRNIGHLNKIRQILSNGSNSLGKLHEAVGLIEGLDPGVPLSRVMPVSASSPAFNIQSRIKQLKKSNKKLRNQLSKLAEEVGIKDVSDRLMPPLPDSTVSFISTSSSIGHSKKIRYLMLSGCYSLRKLHSEVRIIDGLEVLDVTFSRVMPFSQSFNIPSSIGQLKNLKQLLLNGCCNLSKLPEEVGLIDSLETLNISFSGVKQLPASVERLRNLEKFKSIGCKRFTPPSFSGFESLTKLDLTYCRLETFPESISLCFSLKKLLLSKNKFMFLPPSIKNLSKLERLFLNECKSLQELPELPRSIREVLAYGCESLKTICNLSVYRDARKLWFAGCPKLVGNEEISILMGYKFLCNQIKENKRQSSRVYTFPGSKIPEWININNVGGSVTLHLSTLDLNVSSLLGFAFSAVVSTKNQKCNIAVHMGIGGKIFNFGYVGKFSLESSENLITVFYPIKYFTIDELQSGGTVEVCFVTAEHHSKRGFYTTNQTLQPAPEVKECGARIIYEDDEHVWDPPKLTQVVKHEISKKRWLFRCCLFVLIPLLLFLYYLWTNMGI